MLIKRIRESAEKDNQQAWDFLLPGAIYAATALSFLRWTIALLPEILDIANKVVGLERTRQLFLRLLGEAFFSESVIPSFVLMLALTVISIFTAYLVSRRSTNSRKLDYQVQLSLACISFATGRLLLWFTYNEVIKVYRAAAETGTDPGIWPQVVSIVSGVILLAIAWVVWRNAEGQPSNSAFWGRLLVALFLMTGGYLLISEILTVIAAGDRDLWDGGDFPIPCSAFISKIGWFRIVSDALFFALCHAVRGQCRCLPADVFCSSRCPSKPSAGFFWCLSDDVAARTNGHI
jgi:hypothetical protein